MVRSSAAVGRRSAILYQNDERDITLIDIPTSIAVAQDRRDTLLSTSALEAPILLAEEPKLTKAKAKAAKTCLPASEIIHSEYRDIINEALAKIHSHVSGPWCVQREVVTQAPRPQTHTDDAEKELENRLREWAAVGARKGEEGAFDFQKMMASLGTTDATDATVTETESHKWHMSYRPARETADVAERGHLESQKRARAEMQEPWVSCFHNPEKHALHLTVYEAAIQDARDVQKFRFMIPPRSTFFLNDSTYADAFRASFRELTSDFKLPRHFDLVLLDPPWPNRSAKRKGAYEQVGGMPHLARMLRKLDIDHYLEHNALVGLWITNKEAIREHVLGAGGLFESWNVGLVEEWIWVKTTVKGEPMFDLNSTSRRPYECLLLGRAAPNIWTTMAPAPLIKKRVVVAVPDIHSRKPCLKELLEQYMPHSHQYTALEVFPRYLVSGWTSWGNEALKYNWDQYWRPRSLGA